MWTQEDVPGALSPSGVGGLFIYCTVHHSVLPFSLFLSPFPRVPILSSTPPGPFLSLTFSSSLDHFLLVPFAKSLNPWKFTWLLANTRANINTLCVVRVSLWFKLGESFSSDTFLNLDCEAEKLHEAFGNKGSEFLSPAPSFYLLHQYFHCFLCAVWLQVSDYCISLRILMLSVRLAVCNSRETFAFRRDQMPHETNYIV